MYINGGVKKRYQRWSEKKDINGGVKKKDINGGVKKKISTVM